jgi:integrase
MLVQLSNISVPVLLRGPVLNDRRGLPRYWSTVWSTIVAAPFAASTHIKKLRYIENLYAHADAYVGKDSLDDALGLMDEDRLSIIMESWFVSIRNRSNGTDSDEKRWQTGLDFVTSVVAWVSIKHADDRIRSIEKRLHRLSTLYSQLHVRRVNPVETIRSLPASVVEALYEMLDPESNLNPFTRLHTRWRVFMTFTLLLRQGLRRGELLLLPCDVVKSAFDARQQRIRYWINIRDNEYEGSEHDPRHSKPAIKTSHSYRQLPVSEPTVQILDCYVENYRGRPQHSYLLNSPANSPLSTEALTKIFGRISGALPASVMKELEERTGKKSVTPHDLRHTCAVVRLHQLLEQGDSMDEALQKMRSFFGWSRTSSMPTRYAGAVFEDRLASVWNDAFDDRVALIRALPKGH